MKQLHAFSLTLLSLVGCGGDPNLNPAVDAGTVAQNDVPPNTDRSTDTATPPGDRGSTTPDTGQTMACVPHPTDTCRGAPLCRPNEDNVLCEGALACTCQVTERDMPEPCRTGEMMPGCMAQISCMPGRNHCNVDLPRHIDWSAFVSEGDFFRNSLLTLTRWRENGQRVIWDRYEWRVSDDVLAFLQDGGQPPMDEHGFRTVTVQLPPYAIRREVGDISMTFRCAGNACYFRRGLSGLPGNSAWSAELSFEGRCAALLRVFRPDGTEDMSKQRRFYPNRPNCT